MIETITLAPHEGMPSGPGPQVIVLRRFQEDNAAGTSVEIVLTGSPEQVTHPRKPDGTPMHLHEAIVAARHVAKTEGLDRIYVLDRLGGPRERDILRHDGDHSMRGTKLQDTDPEDGVRGTDMRDIAHRPPSV